MEIATEECLLEWEKYLAEWEDTIYARLFAPRQISKDAALTCWFVNRLRNAIPDEDAGNEPWK
jgi:hypothetical protein